MQTPKALVIRTAGTNCELELCRAFTSAGAQAELIHLDRLIAQPDLIDQFDLIGFPGGFAYGDDIASGRILAMHLRQKLLEKLKSAADRGVPMIGICNGFQVLVQLGLLPSINGMEQAVALTENDHGRFIDRWVQLEVNEDSPCVWTKGLSAFTNENMQYPVAHAEGRVVTKDQATLELLKQQNLIALSYSEDINGSVDQIAGICDPSGRIFGLMPHPERAIDWNRHPYWTRLDDETRSSGTPGLQLFKNAVESVLAEPIA